MKIIPLLLFLSVSATSFSQKLTYAELKGVWRQACTFDIIHNSYWHFVDSKHLVVYNYVKGEHPKADTVVFTYTIDNSSPITLIHLFNPKYVELDYYWFIKIDKGILQAQGDMDGNGIVPIKWDNNVTLKNTAPFYKVDKVGSIMETPSHKKWLDIQMAKLRGNKK